MLCQGDLFALRKAIRLSVFDKALYCSVDLMGNIRIVHCVKVDTVSTYLHLSGDIIFQSTLPVKGATAKMHITRDVYTVKTHISAKKMFFGINDQNVYS